MNGSDIVTELLQGTSFEVMSDSRVLTKRLKVRTPIEALNCLLGGGFPLGIVAHAYGAPKSGKSTVFYQTMGIFQKQYPDGIAVIVDQESSADPNRLRALGVKVEDVVRLPSTSIENGFLSLMKLLDNKEKNPALKNVPIFVIWDTISKGLATDGQTQSRVAAMDRARIIKNYMGELQKAIEKHDFFLGLINQIIYVTDFYGNTKVSAGGGIALQHDNQLSLYLELSGDQYNDYNMLVKRFGKLNIDKSKISPELSGLSYHMNVSKGAYIEEVESFVSTMIELGFIDSGKAWVKHSRFYNHDYVDDLSKSIMDALEIPIDKSWRQDDLFKEYCTNPYLYKLLQHCYMNMIEHDFTLQAEVISDYHQEVLEELKEMCLKDGVLEASEFDKLAYGVVPESEDTEDSEVNTVEEES